MNGDTDMTDADLVRYLDGELDGETVEAMDARLAADPALAKRLDMLRSRSARFSSLLVAVDPADACVRASERVIRRRVAAAPAPSAWRRIPPPLRAAAVVVLILTTGLAVPPARAWVLEQVQAVAEALGIGNRAQPPERIGLPTTAPDARDAEVVFGFPVASGVFEVRAPDTRGVLVIHRSTEPDAWITVRGAAGAEPLVQPGVLRLDGPGDEAAVYELALPGGVTTVRVWTGAGGGVDHTVPPAGETLRIELGQR